jgi:hypothetical protein
MICRQGTVSDAFGYNYRRGVWVPACAGTTTINSRYAFRFSRCISRPMPSMRLRSQIEPGSIRARVG